MGHNDAAHIMGLNKDDIEVWAAGLNHFQWLLEIRDKKTGMDLYGQLAESEKKFDPLFEPLSRKMFNYFGKYPSCSDDHIGEYLQYGWQAGEEGYNFDWDESYRQTLKNEIEAKVSGNQPLGDWLTPSPERSIHVVTGILNNKKVTIESGIVYNRGAILNLPGDAAVEVPVMLDAGGIHPICVGNLPTAISKLCITQIGVQQMAVEAAVNGSRELALQALLIDPVVTSADAAVKLLDELWEINKQYIRKCI
jgi:alpha-galactosidase